MNITVFKTEPIAIKAWTEKRIIYLELTDGRIFGFPVDRFRILSQASENQLKAVQIEVGNDWVRYKLNILRWLPSSGGCESILKAYKNLYLKEFNLLIFMICTEYKPRFVLQILNTFTISPAWEPS